LIDVFAAARAQIDSEVEHPKRMESDDVLREISSGLAVLGFAIEQGKTKAKKLPRPVFYGDEGTFLRTYEIDAFDPQHGVALEVEAGRATMGNAVYRDLVQASLRLRGPPCGAVNSSRVVSCVGSVSSAASARPVSGTSRTLFWSCRTATTLRAPIVRQFHTKIADSHGRTRTTRPATRRLANTHG
jgi:hypothetical protein